MSNIRETILVTGAAGFIGAAIVKKLLKEEYDVLGIDNVNDYYDVSLKERRIHNINNFSQNTLGTWKFHQISIEDSNELNAIFKKKDINIVINLAAQAGVRYSLINPESYVRSNILGFLNILECCRKYDVKNLIYASSSSVYGGNKNMPYKESSSVDHPVSFYAATKKSNEIMAHSFSHLYGISATGLRFFTVYGPWGRPDMAPIIFAKAIMEEKPIKVFNFGKMKRDFTYIDDVVEGIYKCCKKPASIDDQFDYLNPNPSTSYAPHRIFNLGNNSTVELLYFIELLEKNLGKKSNKILEPMQNGDVVETCADTDLLTKWIGYKSKVSIEEGIEKFSQWFLKFYNYGK